VSKINRGTVIAEALDLLDEVGLDAVSTRRLATRLGVEQPSLYWHFRKKEDLLAAMAEAAMVPHATAQLPQLPENWRTWFLENTRSFRRTLLMRRDGARLHAGLVPGADDLARITQKMAFLIASGVPEREAHMGMLTASRFTVGSVLEEQADTDTDAGPEPAGGLPQIDHESAFEAGLALIADGLAVQVATSGQEQPGEADSPS
jgi:TetR/AcrR family tetracycline transcriptional repressor